MSQALFPRLTRLAVASLVLALAPGVHGVPPTITLTPGDATIAVGQTLQFTPNGTTTPTAVATGSWHTCLLFSDRSVRCVGRNNQGQLGNGTYDNGSNPTAVSGLGSAVSIRTGHEHTCALIADGTMQCWGTNYTGQLGDGTIGGSSVFPVTVLGISNAITAVTGGFHTCAILADHTVKCWGRNHRGQLGNGTETSSSTPVPVSGMSSAAAISPGGYHTCALLQNGSVRCWGQNDFGQIGSESVEFSSVPLTVSGISNATAVIAGFQHTCAILSDGTVRCWGRNDYGQLGDGQTTHSGQPVQVTGIISPSAVAAGLGHTCALVTDLSVRCWGENDFGELGNGTTIRAPSPVKMNGTGLTWSSSNTAVATVDAAGRATGLGQGTTTITVTDYAGNSASATLRVGDGLVTLWVQPQGDGSGTVTSAPAGIACGSTCSADYANDTQVTLAAAPAAGSVFAGWNGCDTVSGTTCGVTMNQARPVAATFTLPRSTLTVIKTGLGNGTVTSLPAGINCGSACAADFVTGATITLTPTAGLGSVFVGWSGCDSVSGEVCSVTLTAGRSVTAEFFGLPGQ